MKRIIMISVVFLFSCSKKENNKNNIKEPSMSISDKKIDSLLSRSINQGDTIAYNEVSSHYFLEGKETDFFYYAMIMANKFNNKDAHYDAYICLLGEEEGSYLNGISMHNSDETTKNLGMYYLIRSYELGNNKAKSELMQIFSDGKIPNSNFYLKKLQSLNPPLSEE